MANQPPHNPAQAPGVAAETAEAWPLGAAVAGRWQGARSLQARPALVRSGAVERRERWLAQLGGGAGAQPLVHTPLADALAQALAEAPLLLGKLGVMSRTLSMGELADLVQLVLEEEADAGAVAGVSALPASDTVPPATGATSSANARAAKQTASSSTRPAAADPRLRRPARHAARNRHALAAVRGALRALAHREALAAVAAAPARAAQLAAGLAGGAADSPDALERDRTDVRGPAAPQQAESPQVPGDANTRRAQVGVEPLPAGPTTDSAASSLLGSLMRVVSGGAGTAGRILPERSDAERASALDSASLRPVGLTGRAARIWGLSWLRRDAWSIGRATALGGARDAASALSDAVWLALSQEAEAEVAALGEPTASRPAMGATSAARGSALADLDDRVAATRQARTDRLAAASRVQAEAAGSALAAAEGRGTWKPTARTDASAAGVAPSPAAHATLSAGIHSRASGLSGRRRAAAWGPAAAAFASALAGRWLQAPTPTGGDRAMQPGPDWSFAQSGGAADGFDYVVPAAESLGEVAGASASAGARASRSAPRALAGAEAGGATRQAAARISQRPDLMAASSGGRGAAQRRQAAADSAAEVMSGALAFAQSSARANLDGADRAPRGTGQHRRADLRAIAAAAGMAHTRGAAAQLALLARTSPLWRRWSGQSDWTEVASRPPALDGLAAPLAPVVAPSGSAAGGRAPGSGSGADLGVAAPGAAGYGAGADLDRPLLALGDDPGAPQAAAVAESPTVLRDRPLRIGPERASQAQQSAGRAPMADRPPAALRAALQALGLARTGGEHGAAGEFAAAWLGSALPAAARSSAVAQRALAADSASGGPDRQFPSLVQPDGPDPAVEGSTAERAARALAAGQRPQAGAAAAHPATGEAGLIQLQGFAALAALGLPPADWGALTAGQGSSQTTSLAADGGRGELLAASAETAGAGTSVTAETSADSSGRAGVAARSERARAERSGVLGFVPAGLRVSRDLLSWDRRAAAWRGGDATGERWQSRRFGPALRRGTPRHGSGVARSSDNGWGLEQVGALLSLGDLAEGGYFGEALAGPGQAAAAEALHGTVAARRGAALLRGHAGAVARQSAAAATGRVGEFPAAFGDLPADFSAERALLQPASAAAASVQAAGQRGGATAAGQATQAAGMARVLSVTSQPAANTLPLVAPMAQAMVQVAAAKPLSESVVTSGADPTMALPQTGGVASGSERGRGDTAQQAGEMAAAAQDVDALAQKIARSVMVRLKRERERRGLYG